MHLCYMLCIGIGNALNHGAVLMKRSVRLLINLIAAAIEGCVLPLLIVVCKCLACCSACGENMRAI